jgi:hypothetical protein
MKNTITSLLLFGLLSLSASLMAQENNYQEKVKTLDSTLETLYAVISGEKGEERDWDLFRYLFIPEARLIPTGKNAEGVTSYQVMTPDEYVALAGKRLVEMGFYEKEISREVDQFGPVVQAFSTYESYRSQSDATPFARGINSIQLFHDGDRWWVVSIFWNAETSANPIPDEYLD